MDVYDQLKLILTAVFITVIYVEFETIKKLLRKMYVTR
jgi:hypothetical protein